TRHQRPAARSWPRSNSSRNRARTSGWSRPGQCRRPRSGRRCNSQPWRAASAFFAANRPIARTESQLLGHFLIAHSKQEPPGRNYQQRAEGCDQIVEQDTEAAAGAEPLEGTVGPSHRPGLDRIEEAKQRERGELAPE